MLVNREGMRKEACAAEPRLKVEPRHIVSASLAALNVGRSFEIQFLRRQNNCTRNKKRSRVQLQPGGASLRVHTPR